MLDLQDRLKVTNVGLVLIIVIIKNKNIYWLLRNGLFYIINYLGNVSKDILFNRLQAFYTRCYNFLRMILDAVHLVI